MVMRRIVYRHTAGPYPGLAQLPCGCILVTENAHVVDIRRCPPCQSRWDLEAEKFATLCDQEIEDAIFKDDSYGA